MLTFTNGLQDFTESAQFTGPENIAPERTLPSLLAPGAVNSPIRITLKNNEKIRPRPDRENAFDRSNGGQRGRRTHARPVPRLSILSFDKADNYLF